MFQKILIANRGEIACRVIRTARRMGIGTVAVYSDADAQSLHVALADEAFRVGTPEAKDSYLRGDRIIDAARRSGARAVHPGYGFLSENAEFAENCERADITFIGPPAAAIRAMGDKSTAKTIMEKAGVPVVPGYHGKEQATDFLLGQAEHIGFPVLIKAAAGGGGKGMRVVERAAEFDAALAACRREAKSAFGDERVLIEKFLQRPRHIEVQVFADRHGGCVYLFERDCSVQRRHQKVIEEAPAPGMTEKRRREMGEAAVAAARTVGYVGAGTVEFIAERAGTFHFMEMNTRLQVEHPVTEMITGLDLVEWQLRVAAGEKLPLAQKDLRIDGHAIEVRIYAEDPGNSFLPAAGRIAHLGLPAESECVRVDTGVRAGDEIAPHYDPLIAKLIVLDSDRDAALARMQAALGEFEVAGITTNIGFLLRLVQSRAFAQAELETGLIERHPELLAPHEPPGENALALATLAALLQIEAEARERALRSAERHSPWSLTDDWHPGRNPRHALVFDDGEHRYAVIAHQRGGKYELELAGRRRALKGHLREDGRLLAQLDGVEILGRAIRSGNRIEVFLPGEHHILELHDPLLQEFESALHEGELAAPMSGKIVAVFVEAGSKVAKGAPLLILEAMKMEHTLTAPVQGTVAAIRFKVGEQVSEGAELIAFEAEGRVFPGKAGS